LHEGDFLSAYLASSCGRLVHHDVQCAIIRISRQSVTCHLVAATIAKISTDDSPGQRHNFCTSRSPGLTQRGCKTVSNMFGGTSQGIDFKVRIPSGRRCMGVTEQFPDDRQPKPSSGSEARVGVAEIVETPAR
jgi:hypothetical protein